MKKRNKINLSLLGTDHENNVEKLNKVSKVRLDLFQNDDDDEGNEEAAPLPFFKRNKKKPVNDLTSLEHNDDEVDTSYDKLFNNEVRPKKDVAEIRSLNLEELSEEEAFQDEMDGSEDERSFPTKKEIEQLKIRKAKSRSLLNRTNRTKEKDYVALLDDEDKLEIMETIQKNGGNKKEDALSDIELEELEDERLPLSNQERQIQEHQKKQMIDDALNASDDEITKTWENQLLNKGAKNAQTIPNVPSLPVLCPHDDFDDDHDNPGHVNSLSSALSAVQLRKKQLQKQLQTLNAQKLESEGQKTELVKRLLALDI